GRRSTPCARARGRVPPRAACARGAHTAARRARAGPAAARPPAALRRRAARRSSRAAYVSAGAPAAPERRERGHFFSPFFGRLTSMARYAMPTPPSTRSEPSERSAAAEGITERVDAVSCLDERVRREATPVAESPAPRPIEPGRYLEVQGPGETLLVRLERDVTRIGRGLAADLRLDENSVSRRHAVLV